MNPKIKMSKTIIRKTAAALNNQANLTAAVEHKLSGPLDRRGRWDNQSDVERIKLPKPGNIKHTNLSANTESKNR